MIHALAPVEAPSAPLVRRRPLGGVRGGVAAVVAALAVGVLLGMSSSPSGPALAARRVVVGTPPAAPAGHAGPVAPGDLGSLQAPAPAPAQVAAPRPAATEAPAVRAPAAEPPAAKPKPEPAPKPKPATTKPEKEPAAPAEQSPAPRPPAKHVVVVALADAGVKEVFGPRTHAPYLARELRGQGVLLRRYHAIAHGNLPNLIGLLSGQGANPATDAGCPALTPFVVSGQPAADGQLPGAGCVFGADIPSLPAQLDAAKLGWRAYVEGADPPAGAPPAPCQAPAPAPDGTSAAVDRNPLLFFANIAAAPGCTARVAGFGALAADLAQPAATASAFSLVVPDACHAGRDGACPPGEPAGIQRADAWLREWVPQITAAPAFADDGLLVVTFAEARATGEFGDASSCCGQPRAINEPASADPQAPVPGGGRVGAIVLSPHAKRGATSDVPYNHLSLLRTIEDAFGLQHLGLAGAPDLRPLADDVFAAG